MINTQGKKVLVIGGTGSLGRSLVPMLLHSDLGLKQIRILSRGEHKQNELKNLLFNKGFPMGRVEFFIGDVSCREERLNSAMKDVDYVFHLAATKSIPTAEYNPVESTFNNVFGTINVSHCCNIMGVDRAVFTSTDKSCEPLPIYGAQKYLAERIWVGGNIGKNAMSCKFGAVRYGNVMGSKGSVIEMWDKQKKINITNPNMTRFWWTVEDAARFVLMALLEMDGGETFIPKLKSCTMHKLAEVYDKEYNITGIRDGEKFYESMVGKHESFYTRYWANKDCFIRYPTHDDYKIAKRGTKLEPFFEYTSENCPRLNSGELKRMLISTGICKELEVKEWIRGET